MWEDTPRTDKGGSPNCRRDSDTVRENTVFNECFPRTITIGAQKVWTMGFSPSHLFSVIVETHIEAGFKLSQPDPASGKFSTCRGTKSNGVRNLKRQFCGKSTYIRLIIMIISFNLPFDTRP